MEQRSTALMQGAVEREDGRYHIVGIETSSQPNRRTESDKDAYSPYVMMAVEIASSHKVINSFILRCIIRKLVLVGGCYQDTLCVYQRLFSFKLVSA